MFPATKNEAVMGRGRGGGLDFNELKPALSWTAYHAAGIVGNMNAYYE